MDEVLKWCIDNAKWVFSGIGVFIISLLFGQAVKHKNSQVIKGKSSGIQAGRDVNINKNEMRK